VHSAVAERDLSRRPLSRSGRNAQLECVTIPLRDRPEPVFQLLRQQICRVPATILCQRMSPLKVDCDQAYPRQATPRTFR
jgi:hypothetical protein